MEDIRLAVVYATDFERISPGGIASGLRVLARYLDNRFRLVFVGAGERGDFQPVQRYFEGRMITGISVVPSRWRPAWLPLNILFVAQLFRAKQEILRSADVVNPRRMESAIPFLIWKTKPVILTIHGASDHHRAVKNGLLRWGLVRTIYDLAERFVLSRVDRVLLVSEAGYRYYAGRYPQLSAKFAVVPNAVDLSFFTPVDRSEARSNYDLGASDLVVVYCGRLSVEKGLGVLLEAFAQMVREQPSAHLLIAGDGPELEPLRNMVNVLGLSHVRFLGMVSQYHVREILSCANVFVLPSSFEGFPNAVLEALSCGVPVVAADVGGVREILTGELKRFILGRIDPRSIKEKILEAARAGPEIAPVCIARAHDFDARKVVPELERVYMDVVKSAAHGKT